MNSLKNSTIEPSFVRERENPARGRDRESAELRCSERTVLARPAKLLDLRQMLLSEEVSDD